MIRLLTFILLVCPAWASIAYVNGAQGFFNTGGAGTSSVTTGTFSVSAGNILVCSAFWYSTTTTASLSNVGGDSFVSANRITTGAFTGTSQQWYAKNVAAAGSETVTITLSTTVGYVWLACNQYSGLDTINPYDTSAVGSNTVQSCGANAMTTGNFTTTTASEVIVAGFMIQFPTSTPDIGTGYTMRENTTDYQLWTEDQIVSSLQSGVAATFGTTTCNFYSTVVGTYRAPTATSTTKHHVHLVN